MSGFNSRTLPKNKMGTEVEFAPLRSLDDFILESARFQIPNLKDLDRWYNRVVNNLLYYQTNYFLMSLLVFLIVGIIHPVKMAYGFLAISLAFGVFVYVTSNKREMLNFKRNHPIISLLFIFAAGYFLVYMLGCVVVFFLGIALPLVVTFLHASLRMRNILNKIANKVEFVGLKRTPMGLFLEALGLEQEAVS